MSCPAASLFLPGPTDGTPAQGPACPFPTRVPEDEIHLWCVAGEDINDAGVIRQNEEQLSEPERLRANRFQRPQDRRHFVIGRGMLRRALGACLSIEPRDIAFSQNRFGRLEVADRVGQAIGFNVSHTEGMVVTALASGYAVGVDAERIRADFPYFEIARRHFPSRTFAQLADRPQSLRRARFYDYWVLMEAYAKGRGMGLSLPIGEILFEFDEADPSLIHFAMAAKAPSDQWRFWLSAPSPEHRLAVAGSGPSDRLVVRRLRAAGTAECLHLPMLASSRHDHPIC